MKSLGIVFSTILLMMGLSAGLSVLAQPIRIPHENPLTAYIPPDDPAALLRFYAGVFAQTSARQYQDAQNTIEWAKYANIHPQLQDTIDSFNRLSRQLVTALNNLEVLLHEASALLAQHQTSQARQKLDDARETIQSAQLLLADVETATDTLADRLGVFASGDTQTRLYYDRLLDSVRRLEQLIGELDQLRKNLIENPETAIAPRFYYPTTLEVSAPDSAYRGAPIIVSGRIISRDAAVYRTVRVLFDNTQLAEKTVPGRFAVQATVPEEITTGKHSLTLVVLPKEPYASASITLPIYVSVIPIRIEAQVPQTVILPKPIQIRGQVRHELGPLQAARVELNFRGYSSTAKTAADGSFTTSIETPFNLSLIGPQQLSIAVEPAEPRYGSLEVRRWILAINPLSSGVMLAAIFFLGLMLFSRVRISLPRPALNGATVKESSAELSVLPPLPGEPELGDIKSKILSAYVSGLKETERVTNLYLAPHTTLREYLNSAAPRLAKAIGPFAELTSLAENALYSAHNLDQNAAARAKRLADSVIQELSGGTA